MTLEEFNSRYIYKSDKDKFNFFEVWEIPKLEKDGFYYGDCESYCRFLKENIKQFKEWNYYYCKLNGVGHCILSNEALVIDCNLRQTMLKDKFIEKYKITNLKKYNLFVVFSKIIFSYFYIKFKK